MSGRFDKGTQANRSVPVLLSFHPQFDLWCQRALLSTATVILVHVASGCECPHASGGLKAFPADV